MHSDTETENREPMLVFGGSGSPRLTRAICDYLGVSVGRNETIRFSDGNIFVRILETVRGRRVYVVQSTAFPTNDNFMELLFWNDAFRRASAEKITVVMPYFSYAKGDKKDEPRVSIRGRVCAEAIEMSGADRVVTVDLHSPQVSGFFRIPVDDLYALPVIADHVRAQGFRDLVVVSPDIGFAKQARKFARALGAPVAIAEKERMCHDEHAHFIDLIGDVRGKTALIVDDFTATAGTIISVTDALLDHGATEVYAAVTHGVLTNGAAAKVNASRLKELIITDSVETHPGPILGRIRVLSIAPLLGEAIRRIHNRESMSDLFPY